MRPPPSEYPENGISTNDAENRPAVNGLVMGILALAASWIPCLNFLGIILGVIGVVMGHKELNRARDLQPIVARRGVAQAALVTGYLAIAIGMVMAIFDISMLQGFLRMCNSTPSDCG